MKAERRTAGGDRGRRDALGDLSVVRCLDEPPPVVAEDARQQVGRARMVLGIATDPHCGTRTEHGAYRVRIACQPSLQSMVDNSVSVPDRHGEVSAKALPRFARLLEQVLRFGLFGIDADETEAYATILSKQCSDVRLHSIRFQHQSLS